MSLEPAIARLERVCERLERLEAAKGGAPAPAAPAAARPAAPAAPAAAPVASGGIAAYDEFLATHVAPITKAGAAIDKDVQKSSELLVQGLKAAHGVMEVSTRAKRPDSGGLSKLLAPVAEAMMAAGSAAEGRRVASMNHLKVAAEAAQALSWLAYTGPNSGMPAPAQFIAESWSAAEFYANKIAMEHRNSASGAAHMEWVRLVKEAGKKLAELVKKYYPNGLTWNDGGVSVEAAMSGGGAKAGAAAPAGRGPPPPAAPPPPPPGSMMPKDEGAPAKGGGGAGAADALFKEINKGPQGLRKVTDDMKAKNRSDRSGVVPATAPPAAKAAAPAAGSSACSAASGPPKLELQQGRKWVIENQVGNAAIVLDKVDAKQSVYIFGCRDSVVQIKGKVSSVAIDSCSKCGVVVQDLIASLDLVNSKAMQVQCDGIVPTVSVDKVDGLQLFLSKPCAANPTLQIVTAKSSEVNVVVMPDSEREDSVEHAVPEQYISTFQAGRLVTVAAAHAGA